MIQREGMLPSTPGGHGDMDENIQPVFTVADPEGTYGLLFFKLDPRAHRYAMFTSGIGEHLIYTPRLSIPLEICLKSTELLERVDFENANIGGKPTEIMKYRDRIQQRLEEQGIGYSLVQSDSFQEKC